jgi:FtsP/CotA-like multicopper oxidase with cupredoxin domain
VFRRFSTVCSVIAAVCLGLAVSSVTAWLSAASLSVQKVAQRDVCARPAAGGALSEPQDMRSRDGVLELDLSVHDEKMPDSTSRYCYLTSDGQPSPNLRLKPGDLLIIHFQNDLTDLAANAPEIDRALAAGPICTTKKPVDACASGAMTPVSTNLHFHGLSVPPVCHQDDVLRTSIQPDDPVFDYRLRIPEDAAPGLYWYHPHIHDFSKTQVLGGASGALIIEGIERADPQLAGLPERVLVIRATLIRDDAVPLDRVACPTEHLRF